MRRFAAVVAIGVGVLFSCAPGCSPPVGADQQAGPAVDRPTDSPLPSGERAGGATQFGEELHLQRAVEGEQNELVASASPSSLDPEDRETDAEDDAPLIDPLSANAACYVCHMTFIYEEFSRVHLAEKITCIECHGVSGPHANDENIGATPPDITFEREEVDASCAECHEEHDAPARKVIARWLERRLSDCSPICTDCHGMHKIEQPEEEEEKAETKKEAGSAAVKSDPSAVIE